MTMLTTLALLVALTQDPEKLQTVEDLGLRIAPGFKITLFADHTLANDIYAMTLDSKGRVVREAKELTVCPNVLTSIALDEGPRGRDVAR